MNGEPKQATSATTALIYITLGALMDVWASVYFFYVRKAGAGDATYLWISGFFFTGLVLIGIGLLVGRIGRAARPAEVAAVPPPVVEPPIETTRVEPVGSPTPIVGTPVAEGVVREGTRVVREPGARVGARPVRVGP